MDWLREYVARAAPVSALELIAHAEKRGNRGVRVQGGGGNALARPQKKCAKLRKIALKMRKNAQICAKNAQKCANLRIFSGKCVKD